MFRFPFLKPRVDPVAALYGDIVAAARAPVVFRDFGVSDNFEGRFERLVLVATLVLRRMKELPAPADALAQKLVDRLFADLDDGLRIAGVGDLSVGKKMKSLAKGFYGRAEAYTAALEAGDDVGLRAALARNLFAGSCDGAAIHPEIIADVHALAAHLDLADLDALLAGGILNAQYQGSTPTTMAASGTMP